MKNALQLQADLISKEIRIIMGFEVDYNPEIPDKDFNNNGTWGKIVNTGVPVLTIAFNLNDTERDFGKTDYQIKYSWMQKQMDILYELPTASLEYFASCQFHVIPNESLYK